MKLLSKIAIEILKESSFDNKDFDKFEVDNDKVLSNVKQFIEPLAKKGMPIGKKIGEGTKGAAYESGDKVVKITDDSSEANACAFIIGKNIKNVYKIFKVYKLGETGYYAISQERLQPLDTEAKNLIDKVAFDITEISQSYDTGEITIDSKEDMIDLIERLKGFSDINPGDPSEKKANKVFNDILSAMIKLHKIGISYFDYHSGNILKDSKGNYVVIDLGYSESPKGNIEML